MIPRRQPAPPIDSELARQFFFRGDRRGVLLIHGFTGTPAHLRPLGEALHKEGYTVLGVCLSGHGTTIEDMERFRWSDWLRDVRDGFHRLAATCDEIYVAGLSMGGVLSLILAQEQPLQAVVSIAAPMRLINRTAYFAFLAKHVMRYQRWRGDPDHKPSPYDLGYRDTPIRKIPDLLRLMRMAERGLSRITCPLLIVQGDLDRTVRADSPQIIYGGATRCASKRILRLEKSRHVCTVEPEFDALYTAISEHFRQAAER